MDSKLEAGQSAFDREAKLEQLRMLLGDGRGIAEATAAQERFWVLSHSGGDASQYHVAEAVEVTGDFDVQRFERCLEALVERHEALRTAIAVHQGKPIQVIRRSVRLPLVFPKPAPDRSIEETLREIAAQPFELSRPPLWRVAVVSMAPDQHAVLVVFHHLISDGWSLSVFLRELLLLYLADLEGVRAELPPALQYREYWSDRQKLLADGREQAEERYWRETLRELPKAPTLPFDSPRPVDGRSSGAWLPFELGAREQASARALARVADTTLFGVFITVLNATLHALSGDRDLLIGTVASGRHGRREWETVLGPLLNSLVLRTQIEETETFTDFLRRSRESLLAMLENQDVPFDRIVDLAKAPRRPGLMPFTQVGIVYHEYPVRAPSGLPFTLHPLPFDPRRAQLDLSLVILNEEGRLRCRFEYDSGLLREETVRIVRNVFLKILEAAGARPEARVSEVCRAAYREMLPLHLTQHMRQIWQGEQIFADPLLYRQTTISTIPKALDVAAFLKACDFVVQRTDSLRAYVDSNSGHPRLRFRGVETRLAHFHDFSKEPDPRAAFRAWVERELLRPADLERVPFRSDLARLGPEEYAWQLTHHHMFCDGQTVALMIERVSNVYEQLVAGRFDPDTITYPQMAEQLVTDLEYQRSGRFRKDASYWAKRLAAGSEPLSFYGRPPKKSGTHVDRVPFRLGAERSARLRALSTFGLTSIQGLDAFLCNAFGVCLAVYLHKVSGGVKRVVFGSVNHNRRTPESRKIMGGYMQVVPHVLELEDGETFRSLMRKMDREVQAALRHGQYAVESTVSRPVYDVLLNYHKEAPVLFAGTRSSYEVIVRRATQSFGINVTNYDLSDDLEIQFDFHREVFDEEQYGQVAQHFLQVIDALIENVDTRVTSVCLLSEDERRRLLVSFNETRASFPLDVDFYTAFRKIASEYPDATAATDAQCSVTYSELAEQSERLAARLFAAGVRPSSIVPILTERSIPYLRAMLALLRLGAAFLPLDPSAPRERLAHILKECGATVLLASPALFERVPEEAGVERLSLSPTELASEGPTPSLSIDTERLAYVIYTSGSTGRPKGVLVKQRGMLNHLYAKIADLRLTPGDVVVQNASQCFDISVWQFLSGLLVGAKTQIVPDTVVLEPEAFLGVLEAGGASVVELVPSYLRALLDHWDHHPTRAALPAVRVLLVTGEALPPDLARRWMQLRPEVPMVNAYGPTECSDDVTHHFLYSAPESWESSVPIGKPIANTQLYVLDAGLQPVPVGVEGELFVGGEGVGLGYLGDEAATRRAFIPNPLGIGTSTLLYRTGDRASFRADGCLEFHGRFDHQIKLRGYRIELGEVEQVLRSHPAIANAVVALRKVRGSDALVAYLEPAPETSTPGQTELGSLAASMLPGYMVPQHWVFVSKIPLTANGKTDHSALPEPTHGDKALAPEPTFTELERALSEIWELVLERPIHEPNLDFFEAGGDSLRAIQALSLASARGFVLSMQDFLARPTLRGMAASVTRRTTAPAVLSAVDATGEVPLVAVQARFFQAPHAEPSHDNLAIWLSLEASKAAHVEAALRQLCSEHDVFRLRFERNAQGWVQLLDSETRPPLVVRRRLERTAGSEAKLASWATQAQRCLSLERGTLMAGLLVEGALPARASLLLIVHHLVTDAVSSRLLLGRLEELLTALSLGETPRATRRPRAPTFTAYARELRRAVNAGTFDDQALYWLGLGLRDTARLFDTLPEHNRVADQREISVRIPSRELTTSADTGSLPGGVANAALAALVHALGRWGGPARYAIGLVGTGREWSPPGLSVEGTVGWFNAFTPVVFEVTGGDSVAAVASDVRKHLAAVPMGGFAYGALRYLHPDPELRAALDREGDPPISFNYLGRLVGTDGGLQVAPLERGATRSPLNARQTWLQAECWDAGESFVLRIDFHAAFPEQRVALLLEHWQSSLLHLTRQLVMSKTGS